jgi:hypothetical protein
MLYHTDFRDRILTEPVRQGADSLKIISGYATDTMASWHITEILTQAQPSINISLIVGMCAFYGISKGAHEGFKSLIARNNTGQSNLTCQYVVEGAPVHSKLYLWEIVGSPFSAYMGSANYTQSAFSRVRRELLQECDPPDALAYYDSEEAHSMFCNHAEIEEYVKLVPTHPILKAEESPLISLRGSGVEYVTLSLLSRTGAVGDRSGLNWGQRPKRNPNQAYIPLPVKVMRSGFFPLDPDDPRNNPHFSVLTDDGKQLILRVEQQNNKAITTPANNSLLGEYFRNRLSVSNGEYITNAHLSNYGRTDVTFYKFDDEQFFMDFSV